MVVTGCGRPFIDISDPESVVVDPDLSIAQTDGEIMVAVRSTSFRNVVRVKLNGVDMSHASGDELWTLPVTLAPGINLLRIEAHDEENRVGIDSTYALFVDYDLETTAAALPFGLGGHSAVLLSDGSVFVTGGAENSSADASASTFLFSPSFDGVDITSPPLHTARVGHTSTNVGQDQVLIIGGAQRAEISAAEELIESVELYSHETRTTTDIPVQGPPIRRMYHTATFRNSTQGPILDLIGGTGDVQYFPEPLLSIRGDIRSFLFRNDSLLSLSPAVGPFIEQLSGHIQVPVTNDSPGDPAAFLLAGVGGIPPGGPIGLLVDFTTNLGILVDPVSRAFSTRTSHAAAKLNHDIIGMFGGINWPEEKVIGTAELYVYSIGQSFQLPMRRDISFTDRYSHTATMLPSGQVIIIGGFNPAGAGLTLSRLFSYSIDK